MSSLHVMIEVMMYGGEGGEGTKKVRQVTCQDCGMIYAVLLQQIQFFGTADSRPAIVDPQLGVNVLGVGTHGI
jgi:hypothetical protein